MLFCRPELFSKNSEHVKNSSGNLFHNHFREEKLIVESVKVVYHVFSIPGNPTGRIALKTFQINQISGVMRQVFKSFEDSSNILCSPIKLCSGTFLLLLF